ncbi:hypothetical protein, variant 1 [Aphanomyces invadans]|uniref:FYVE-type domain-containing protein n=1 Tax=Aphanomyces invadans TaxID=157072 RepID=A0A024UL01_9STRA|nr:hypothetical protein, variant 1 [Aphanomyces invadans]ETW06959.1 hypothetical protein, variant 1 [Aphanomyces invadans]|eukprot:XP_008865034.1 hypothetical protein, variant 1 [Aphanomyces invadans]
MSNLPAIELAERSAWKALHALLLEHPSSAKECDDYGMLPLHWACTDPSVTAAVVQTLLDLHPTGARTKNTAGLLPLHIAIKAEIDVPIVDSILQAYPAALEVRTPHGDTPGDLARKLASPQELCDVLHIEYDVPRRMSVESFLSKSRSSSCSFGGGSQYGGTNGMSNVHLPPRWQHEKACHVCQAKFGPFRSRHHCRGCGVSVCNAHSRGRMALPHLGLQSLQRVCAACYEEFNPEGPGVGSLTLTSSRNIRRIRSQTEDFFKSSSSSSSRSILAQKAAYLLEHPRQPEADQGSDITRPSRTSSESSHDIDLLTESILTLNRTKALLQEQLQATHMVAQQPPLKPRDGTEHWPQMHHSSGAVVDVAQTQHLLGVTLADKGSTAAAIDALRKSISNKQTAGAWYDLGRLLHASGEEDAAEDALRKVADLSFG